MKIAQSRRDFLTSASVAAAAGILGARGSLADEASPEITTIRLGYWPGYACITPQTITEEMLLAEGFTDVRFLPPSHINSVARDEIDFDLETAAWLVSQVAAGEPISVLAGVHVGCFELVAHAPIGTISDLAGKKVGIDYLGGSSHLYLTIMLAQVGLDPERDIEWVANPIEWVENPDTVLLDRFARGEVDAVLAFPPQQQKLRARKVGRVILSTVMDAPWSYYFCCMAFGRRQFVHDYPIATKRYLRAILKATDICATQPAQAARRLMDAGFTEKYEYALQTLTELSYDKWREFDPEDSLRFFALRLHEVGLVESTPNGIIADGTDWRFLNELKRELRA
jgi:NitT/TauT family transport system substrate-binding protein